MKKRTAEKFSTETASYTSPSSRSLAYVEVASSELTRDINRDIVLENIRVLQPTSRVDLARASGLQPSTVSSIVEQLLAERWIRESAMIKTARGRRPTLLSLNDDMVFLVADVRPAQTVAAVVDLSGRFLERQIVPVSKDPGRSVERIAATMNLLREMHSSKTFQGIGVSLPGRVDPRTNQLIFAPNLQWRAYPIAERLRELVGLEVQLENDANASLLAELWFGRIDGIRNAILLTVTEGIGAAILADGRLISGMRGLAGEFGHIALDPDGPQCGCGAKGCWEVFASSSAALRYYRELEPEALEQSIVALIALALDGDVSACAALTRQARAVGQGLHLLNAVMSPDVILLAGDVGIFYDVFRQVIEAECRAGAMDGEGPRVVSVGDGEVSRLRGAAAVVLQRHSGYYRAAHRRGGKR
jgi:predicted NBD/HSP70 family sugar kinase